jgi:hypothetical protein
METHRGTFRVSSWAEQTGIETEEPKLTRVRAGMAYQGVIEGDGIVEMLMYSPDGQVTYFIGFEQVAGQIGGRSGRVVFQHAGTFANGVAKSRWFVVPGSGTGGLAGLRGEGHYGEESADAEHGCAAPLSFSFRFEADGNSGATNGPAGGS